MKIYLVECIAALKARLKRLITEQNLGDIVGSSDTWKEATIDNLDEKRPDVIICDIKLVQREIYAYISKLKSMAPDARLLVLLQGKDEFILDELYLQGVEFVLHKPVNDTELSNILKNLEMGNLLKRAIELSNANLNTVPVAPLPMQPVPEVTPESYKDDSLDRYLRKLRTILRDIGIISETGSKDIINIISYLLEKGLDIRDIPMRDLCDKLGDNPKSIEQRIRRATSAAITSLAMRGIEDYADPIYNEYGDRLFGFEQMRTEINFICGKSSSKANFKIKKFIGGLMDYCLEE